MLHFLCYKNNEEHRKLQTYKNSFSIWTFLIRCVVQMWKKIYKYFGDTSHISLNTDRQIDR